MFSLCNKYLSLWWLTTHTHTQSARERNTFTKGIINTSSFQGMVGLCRRITSHLLCSLHADYKVLQWRKSCWTQSHSPTSNEHYGAAFGCTKCSFTNRRADSGWKCCSSQTSCLTTLRFPTGILLKLLSKTIVLLVFKILVITHTYLI